MSTETWSAFDDYIVDALLPPDDALDAALAASEAAGLPAIAVSPAQGKMLNLLVRTMNAQSVLEVGTLGGYSTIWLARAVGAGGKVVTLEYEPRHAEVAHANIERAGLADRVEIRVGKGVDSMAALADEGAGPFDLFFIDADKPSNPDYFMGALKLARVGSMIVVDNVVRRGKVMDASSDDDGVVGTRRLNELMAAEPRVDATVIQTVGSKGYDGFALALVTA